MKKVLFGVYAEDISLKVFANQVMPQLVKHLGLPFEFNHCADYSNQMDGQDKVRIRENMCNAILKGLITFDLDVCLVGLDADDDDLEDVYLEMGRILADFQNTDIEGERPSIRLEGKTVFFIPQKAIEHWIWYLKAKKDSLPYEDIEHLTGNQVKEKIYKRKRVGKSTSIPQVEKVTQNVDVKYLMDVSPSFNAFVGKFRDFFLPK